MTLLTNKHHPYPFAKMISAAISPAIHPWGLEGALESAFIPGLGLSLKMQDLELASHTYVSLAAVRSDTWTDSGLPHIDTTRYPQSKIRSSSMALSMSQLCSPSSTAMVWAIALVFTRSIGTTRSLMEPFVSKLPCPASLT